MCVWINTETCWGLITSMYADTLRNHPTVSDYLERMRAKEVIYRSCFRVV